MQHRSEVDVLVVGAGPVGLTLANELVRRGVSARIVDRQDGIREISKALIWHVRTQEALDKVGILQRGLAEAKPLNEVVMRAYGKRIGSWLFPGIDSPNPHALIIGQNRTQHLLLDLLRERGGDVDWQTEAVALDLSDEEAVTVTLGAANGSGAGEAVRARYVVGCEGSDSLVRKTLGITFEGERYSGEQFIQADCKISWVLPSGRSYLFLTDDGYLMVIEMPGGFVRVFISLPDADGAGAAAAAASQGAVEDIHAAPALADIRSNLARLTGIDADLSEPVWLARYRTSHRSANTFRRGRCFLAGDAGHVHVPIGGQGMNTGIQDAFNLGWKLAGVANGTLREDILDTYDAERRPVAKALLAGTDRSYRGILHPSDLQQRLVRMFGPFIVKTDAAQHAVGTILEELNIAYDASPLNRDLGGSTGPRPGRRAPLDATVVRLRDKATVTFAELTRADDWIVVAFAGLSAPADARIPAPPSFSSRAATPACYYVTTTVAPSAAAGFEIVVDAEEHLHRAYGIEESAYYLIRPDGVVGLRGPGFDPGAIDAYLGALLRA
jgi:3-(3-hydroxy-phenyl)propionate hydroxylase